MRNLLYTALIILLYCNASAQTRVINIDASQIAGKRSTVFNECIGAGRANEGLRADWQQQQNRSRVYA